MIRRPPRSKRTDTLFPYRTLFLSIIYLLPLLTRAIPSPLVCIVLLSALALWMDLDVRRVGDMGALPDSLPVFLLPQVPWTLETLRSEEHTSELQSLMRISYAVFCSKIKTHTLKSTLLNSTHT